ncbi:hypothetical protein L9F63_010626 [Diploptera punctata]|uniref:Uncharacterized protein n=1 Tax=Diploptera punctata TaxID=6984 RepID=A0AAD8ER38_DIPPU|nr:hypothetical protein L9F63_010626 [Diploptera punctata]
MTSYTYCCGKFLKIMQHLSRLGIATVAWFLWTNIFIFIDEITGECSPSPNGNLSQYQDLRNKYPIRKLCLKNKFYWHGFDISGHSFLLIYSCLILMEEANAIIGWKNIGDLIKNKEYSRRFQSISNCYCSSLGLTQEEFSKLKKSYEKLTPFITLTFILMVLLIVLWNFMLINTLMYFHTIMEKLIGGSIAILTWFITYHHLYRCQIPWRLFCLPGEGYIIYRDMSHKKNTYEDYDNYSDSSNS